MSEAVITIGGNLSNVLVIELFSTYRRVSIYKSSEFYIASGFNEFKKFVKLTFKQHSNMMQFFIE